MNRRTKRCAAVGCTALLGTNIGQGWIWLFSKRCVTMNFALTDKSIHLF